MYKRNRYVQFFNQNSINRKKERKNGNSGELYVNGFIITCNNKDDNNAGGGGDDDEEEVEEEEEDNNNDTNK